MFYADGSGASRGGVPFRNPAQIPVGDQDVSYKILVIDHDKTKVERIQRPLADAGYEVVVATGAEEGMQTLERVQPDLAVIEALLPEKNGSELCQAIKESPQGKSMPVIIMLEEDAEAQAMAKAMDLHGCDMLIDRSIQDQELLELCQGFFEEHNVEAEAPEEPAAETAAPEPAPEQPSAQTDMLLDTYELDSALQKLDSIIEEQPEEEADEAAERGGDFSHIAEEIGAGRPSVEAPKTSIVEELQQQADCATDLDSKLDSLLAMESSAPPPPTETEAPVALYEEIETTAPPEDAAAPPEVEAEVEAAEPEPAVEEKPVAEKPAEEKPLDELLLETPQPEKEAEEPAVYPARSIPFPAAMPEPEAEPGFLKKYWWAVAALLAIVLVGAGLWLMPGDSQPEPLVANLASEGGAAAEESGTAAASMVSAPAPTPTAESEQEPAVVETPPAPKPVAAKPEPKPAAKPVAAKPKPKPKPVAKRTTAKPEPKPAAVKPEPKPEPKPAAAKPEPRPEPAPAKPEPKPEPVVAKPAPTPVAAEPEPKPEPKPEPVVPPPATAVPEPKPEPVKAAPPAALPEPETVKLAPAPIQTEQPPAEPVFKPPVVINRIEPAYPKKALKKSAGRTIILKLLISESGRIIRVTVDQGVPVPELEAAAVSAVLRWRYRPATEDGVPVKAWTTAEFDF
jgi:TonB family protein